MAHLLIVDDDANTLASLARAFRLAGHEATVCDNAVRALDLLKSSSFDMMLSDVVMPGLDGYGFCQAVKSAELTRRIPFVLLTQQNTPADLIKGWERGADNFIPKPFDDDYLLDRVRRTAGDDGEFLGDSLARFGERFMDGAAGHNFDAAGEVETLLRRPFRQRQPPDQGNHGHGEK